jgi:TonB family protein
MAWLLFCLLVCVADTTMANEAASAADSTKEDTTAGTSLIEGSTGDALSSIELAIAAKEVDAAKAELNAYIEQIETATHRYSPELVRPLVVLGDAHMAAGEYEAAGESYGRAVHIDRVANGLHSSSQASIVYKEADAHVALGDLAAANDRELYAYEVQLREYKADSMDMLPATFRLGDWHLKTHNVLMARALYQQAEKTLAKNDQKSGEATMRALKGVATTYRLERFPPVLYRSTEAQVEGASGLPARPYEDNTPFADEAVNYVNNFPQGEKALSRIANIVREDPNASSLDKANAFIDLADWYLLFERPERATPLYVEARRLLTEAQLPQADRFAMPEVLYFPEPPPLRAPAPDDRDEMQLGRVKVGFTVTADGDVNDLVTLESEPESTMEYRVRRSMRVARYRPPLVEDQLAAAADQTFLYEYRYWPKKQKAVPAQAPLKAAGSRGNKGRTAVGNDAGGGAAPSTTEPEHDAG